MCSVHVSVMCEGHVSAICVVCEGGMCDMVRVR